MGDVFTRSVKDYQEWEADLEFYRLLADYLSESKESMVDKLHQINETRNSCYRRSKEHLVSWLEGLKAKDLESWVRLVSHIGYNTDLNAPKDLKLKYLNLAPSEIYCGGDRIDLRLPSDR